MDQEHQYRQLEEILSEVGAAMGAAEAHGLLCGMVAAPATADQAQWVAQVLADTSPKGETAKKLLSALMALYRQTVTAMDDPQLDFQPLLPGDDHPIARRAQALGRWCDGFLLGLGTGQMKPEHELSKEVREILRDLSQISRVEIEAETGEENEDAYAELVEYVRMASLLVLEHMRPKEKKTENRTGPRSGGPTLH